MGLLPFNIFLFIHLVSLITGFGSVLVTDFLGLLYLSKRIPLSFMNRVAGYTQKLIWLGWSGLVGSGIFLITMKGYIDNLTQLKLFFVILVGVNGIFLHLIKKSCEGIRDDEQLPMILKFRVGLATMISQMGWWGALSIGFIHNHWMHTINWPPQPWLYMVTVVGGLLIIGLSGEILLKSKK